MQRPLEERRELFGQQLKAYREEQKEKESQGRRDARIYPRDMYMEFFAYWTEKNESGLMRFETRDYFDIARRLATWKSNLEKYNRQNQTVNPHGKPKSARSAKRLGYVDLEAAMADLARKQSGDGSEGPVEGDYELVE